MMNPNYVHTITIYNKIRATDAADKKEHWKKTVLRNCFWKSVVNTVFGDKEASAQNTYTVRIPQNPSYLPYAEYAKNPEGHFTASQDDIVIHGECAEEITGESGHTAVQVMNRYKPDAFRVTAFSDNTVFPANKHYRLGG